MAPSVVLLFVVFLFGIVFACSPCCNGVFFLFPAAVVRGLMVLQGVTIVWVSVAEHGPRKAVGFIDGWWPCLPCVGRSW